MAFHPNGRLLATGAADGRLCLWDAEAQRLQSTLKGPEEPDAPAPPITAVAFRPDSRAVLTGCDDYSARLWTLAPPSPRPTSHPIAKEDSSRLAHVAHSPDGKRSAKALCGQLRG